MGATISGASPLINPSFCMSFKQTVSSIVSLDSAVSLEEQTRGLDWVHWLLRSVRQSCEGVITEQVSTREALYANWRLFIKDKFIPVLGPALIKSWHSMASRDVEALLIQDQVWASLLLDAERSRSLEAGAVLLARTEGARYQGALGHFREALSAGEGEGHIGVVWPCIAQLFQLSAATMLAEYLRLEWETAARELSGVATPVGSVSFVKVVGAVLNPAQMEPQIMRRRKAG